MKKPFRRLLRIMGGFIAIMLFSMIAVLLILRFAERKVEKASAAIKPGMTIEQMVQNFPHDFSFGRIGESESERCSASGAAPVQSSVAGESPKCLPPAKSISVFRPEESFNITISAEGEEPTHKTLYSAELATLLSTEFAGRGWHASFTYLNSTPRHYSFTVSVGADGRVKEPPRISWMD